jgi:hypothetical protein
VVGGGVGNQANGSWATVGGGVNNIASGNYGTVGGGVGNTASGWSTVGGGYHNTSGNEIILGQVVGQVYATVGGGYQNIATGSFATIPGGINNTASGTSSFAAGANASAVDGGAFVWSDGSSSAPIRSSGANSFTAQAVGGFYFYTVNSSEIGGPAGAQLVGTSWTALSDRNSKKNIAPVNCRAVLDKLAEVPIEHWNYKWEADSAVPHLGPMAQDFIGAFYPGRDDKRISTLEFDGVELAAIEGLNQKLNAELKQKATEITELKQQNDSLEKRLEALEQIIRKQGHEAEER